MTFEGEGSRTMQASSGFHKLVSIYKTDHGPVSNCFRDDHCEWFVLYMANTSVENHGPSRHQLFRVRSALYTAKCAKCHGADGRGDTAIGRSLDAPDFTDESWKTRHSAD